MIPCRWSINNNW